MTLVEIYPLPNHGNRSLDEEGAVIFGLPDVIQDEGLSGDSEDEREDWSGAEYGSLYCDTDSDHFEEIYEKESGSESESESESKSKSKSKSNEDSNENSDSASRSEDSQSDREEHCIDPRTVDAIVTTSQAIQDLRGIRPSTPSETGPSNPATSVLSPTVLHSDNITDTSANRSKVSPDSQGYTRGTSSLDVHVAHSNLGRASSCDPSPECLPTGPSSSKDIPRAQNSLSSQNFSLRRNIGRCHPTVSKPVRPEVRNDLSLTGFLSIMIGSAIIVLLLTLYISKVIFEEPVTPPTQPLGDPLHMLAQSWESWISPSQVTLMVTETETATCVVTEVLQLPEVTIYTPILIAASTTQFDTVTVTESITQYDTVTATESITQYDTVTATESTTQFDTVTATESITYFDVITLTKSITYFDIVTLTASTTQFDTVTLTECITCLDIVTLTESTVQFDIITLTESITQFDIVTLTESTTRVDTVTVTESAPPDSTGYAANAKQGHDETRAESECTGSHSILSIRSLEHGLQKLGTSIATLKKALGWTFIMSIGHLSSLINQLKPYPGMNILLAYCDFLNSSIDLVSGGRWCRLAPQERFLFLCGLALGLLGAMVDCIWSGIRSVQQDKERVEEERRRGTEEEEAYKEWCRERVLEKEKIHRGRSKIRGEERTSDEFNANITDTQVNEHPAGESGGEGGDGREESPGMEANEVKYDTRKDNVAMERAPGEERIAKEVGGGANSEGERLEGDQKSHI